MERLNRQLDLVVRKSVRNRKISTLMKDNLNNKNQLKRKNREKQISIEINMYKLLSKFSIVTRWRLS